MIRKIQIETRKRGDRLYNTIADVYRNEGNYREKIAEVVEDTTASEWFGVDIRTMLRVVAPMSEEEYQTAVHIITAIDQDERAWEKPRHISICLDERARLPKERRRGD